ncbi:MAG: TetR/AcrR family transcriptional regulator [Actinobacteria bacterium]|nr:TetR/AcrR family transcriptional regulator [Actinomycetota bacterium]
MSTPDAPRTARERARAEITTEILDSARAHLVADGAAALSLRAVARDLGMVSSAVYRYVPNRDALLTMLIVDAYDSLGAAVEKAEASIARDDFLGRFLATCHAVRTWALAHPHEYALIYGSPVPGYAAPQDTIAPASRVPVVLTTIIADLYASGAPVPAADVPSAVAASIAPIQSFVDGRLPDDLMLRGMAAWSGLFGAVSFELYGHLHNVVTDSVRSRKAYFDHQMRQVASGLGLASR